MEDIPESLTFVDFKQTQLSNNKKNTSSIWNYFLRVANGKVAKCKYSECNKILKTGEGSTSNLHKHLRSKHRNVYDTLKNSQTGEESGENSFATTQVSKTAVTTIEEVPQQNQMESKDSSGSNSRIIQNDNPDLKENVKYIDVAASKKGGSKKSVWYYFLRAEDGDTAKCKNKMCQRVIKTKGGSTSGLHGHLKGKHNIDLVKQNSSSPSEVKQPEVVQRSRIILDEGPARKVQRDSMESDISTCKDMIWRLSKRVCTLEKEIKNLKAHIILNKVDRNKVQSASSSSNASKTKNSSNNEQGGSPMEEDSDFMVAVKEETVEEDAYESDNEFLNMELDWSEEAKFPNSQRTRDSDSSWNERSDEDDNDYSTKSKKSAGRSKISSGQECKQNRKRQRVTSIAKGSVVEANKGLSNVPLGKRSAVWNYYLTTDDNSKCECRVCKMYISRGGVGKHASTTPLRNHLQGKHPAEYQQMIHSEKNKNLISAKSGPLLGSETITSKVDTVGGESKNDATQYEKNLDNSKSETSSRETQHSMANS